MSRKNVKKAALTAIPAIQAKLAEKKPTGASNGNVWKCVSFLLIGLIVGYLLSPAKGGVLIGSFNGNGIHLPEKKEPVLPPHLHKHKGQKPPRPFAGSVVIGSFNGGSVKKEENKDGNSK